MKPTAENLSMQGDKYLGITYRANNFDCQDFVEHCLKDVGISLNLPGSNAWYRKMTWVGTPEECIKKFGSIPKGAFLYILKKDGKEPDKYKKDNIGNVSHIGIYTNLGKGVMQSGGYDVTPPSGFNGVHDTRTRLDENPPWWTHVAIGKNFVQSGAPSPSGGNFKKWMVILLNRKKVLARERKFF